MNILILNWRDTKNPKSGGAEIVTLQHAKGWIKAGHTVTWFTSNFEKAKDKEIVEGVNTVRKGNFITVYLFAPIFYLFSGHKFDIVIDQIHGLPFFTPLYVKKPIIALIHEVAEEIWDYMYPFPVNKIGKMIEPFYFKLYKKIPFWVPSDSTIEDLIKNGISRKSCTKILCAINNKTLSMPAKKDTTPTLIFVSRLVKMKGIEEVIKAFYIMQKTTPNLRLDIVGEGEKEYVNFLKRKFAIASENSDINFRGFVSESEKLRLMGKARLILHASIKEGWGLVIVEAASQGTPSVVYDVDGLRESTLNNKTGIVLNKNTPEEMAKASLVLLSDEKKYKKFQENSLVWARSLKWDRLTQESTSLVERVANTNK